MQSSQRSVTGQPLIELVGDEVEVPCVDGSHRRYVALDAAASTGALDSVAAAVVEFLPWYSSVHRGAGHKSQVATEAYESAREAVLGFAGRRGTNDVAIFCRNTTEAINHLAYRLSLAPDDVVVTTAVEHHANLLPWRRAAVLRIVECGEQGTFDVAALVAALDAPPRPKLLAMSGASNVTGWLPPVTEAISAAHARGIPVLIDAAQLAPHRALPTTAEFLAFSGHKMYAPFGAGVLIGPRESFSTGDPFLAGGGAVELVDFDEVVWSDPPDREEAGSPNVIGAVALHAAISALEAIGWKRITAHDRELALLLRDGLAKVPGVRLLGPGSDIETLPVATFLVEGVPHALLAARLSAEFGIGVRHGCFCAHPYLLRLLGLESVELQRFRAAARVHDRSALPGAVRASVGLSNTATDVETLLDAVAEIAATPSPPVSYDRDRVTGDYWPVGFARPGGGPPRGGSCARG